MRQFTKTLPARHPLVSELIDAHGAEAYAYLTMLLELAHEIGPFELTLAILARECRIKNPRLSRIFPDMKIIFEKAQVSLGILKKPEETSTKLNEVHLSSTSEVQNPHGSTRDQREERSEREEEISPPTPTPGESEPSPESKKIGQDGLKYAIQSNNPNMSNFGWVEGYLSAECQKTKLSKPEMSLDAFLKTWRETCDDATNAGAHSPKWYRTTFESRIQNWRPGMPSGTQRASPFQAGTKVDPRQALIPRTGRSGRFT